MERANENHAHIDLKGVNGITEHASDLRAVNQGRGKKKRRNWQPKKTVFTVKKLIVKYRDYRIYTSMEASL